MRTAIEANLEIALVRLDAVAQPSSVSATVLRNRARPRGREVAQPLFGALRMTPSGKQDGRKSDLSLLKGVHVLVVEDTWHVAKALKSTLEQVGMHVSGPAATTADAKRLVA